MPYERRPRKPTLLRRRFVRAYAASREAWDVGAVNIVVRREDISSCVGGAMGALGVFASMMGMTGGET